MLSCLSRGGGGGKDEPDTADPSCTDEGRDGAWSVLEVMEEVGERRDEDVEVVVLLRERPLKTERRLGLLGNACAEERERA